MVLVLFLIDYIRKRIYIQINMKEEETRHWTYIDCLNVYKKLFYKR